MEVEDHYLPLFNLLKKMVYEDSGTLIMNSYAINFVFDLLDSENEDKIDLVLSFIDVKASLRNSSGKTGATW